MGTDGKARLLAGTLITLLLQSCLHTAALPFHARSGTGKALS